MATPYKINPHKLVGVAYHAGVTSAPILDDAIAFLECEIKHTLEIDADHILFVGEIVAGAVTKQVESLTLLTSRLRYK